MAGTISTLGVGSGLDLQGILDQLRAADQTQIIAKQTRQLQYEDQLAEFKTVNGKLLSVKNLAFSLSLNGTYAGTTVSSSNEDALTAIATAGSTPTEGTVEMTVGSLAKQNVWQSSNGVADADTAIAAATGTFNYTVDGTEYTVDVDTTTSLQDLVDAINQDEDNPGVTASVMDDGTGSGTDFHLVITSDGTGTDNAITMGVNDTTLTLAEMQVATNAQVTVNNLVYERQTNTIDDIISNLTLTVEGTGDTVVKVAGDTSSVKAQVLTLASAYNEVLVEIENNSGYNTETGVGGSLNGVSAFRSMVSSLNGTLSSSIAGLTTSFDNLAELGFSFERSGLLAVDETVLDAALADNLDDVQGLLVGDASLEIDGVATKLYDSLADITATSDGLISAETNRVQAAIDSLDEDIDRTNTRLDARYDLMSKQFIRLDQLLSSFANEGSFLTSTFKGLNDMWVNN